MVSDSLDIKSTYTRLEFLGLLLFKRVLNQKQIYRIDTY